MADVVTASTARPSTFRRIALASGWVATGLMLLATAFVRWFRTGPGSRFRGLDLADNIRSGVLSPSWGIWVALGLYSIVGIGGIYVATATVRHRGVVIVRLFASALGITVFVILAAAAIPVSNWSAGPTIATAAFVLACVLSAYQCASIPPTPR